ncbi:unnamed protein product, partial [Allacma fusca]
MTQLVPVGQASFNDDIACRAWLLFKTLDAKDVLAKLAREYILKNAAQILRGDTFLDLLVEDFMVILRDDELVVNSEMDVYKAVLRWGVHNLKKLSKQIDSESMRWKCRNYVLPLVLLSVEETEAMLECWNKSAGNGKPRNQFNKLPRRYLKQKKERELTRES